MKKYIGEVSDLRKQLYSEGRRKGFVSDEISDETLEVYFEIIQIGLSQKYHDLSEMPEKDLVNILNLIYAVILSCK